MSISSRNDHAFTIIRIRHDRMGWNNSDFSIEDLVEIGKKFILLDERCKRRTDDFLQLRGQHPSWNKRKSILATSAWFRMVMITPTATPTYLFRNLRQSIHIFLSFSLTHKTVLSYVSSRKKISYQNQIDYFGRRNTPEPAGTDGKVSPISYGSHTTDHHLRRQYDL